MLEKVTVLRISYANAHKTLYFNLDKKYTTSLLIVSFRIEHRFARNYNIFLFCYTECSIVSIRLAVLAI